MNNSEVSALKVGGVAAKEVRKGSRLVLAPNGDQLWYKANTVPSLDLRFADNKSLVDATTGQNLVTFTRASSGTYVDSEGVIQIASTDEPRFDHDPTTGESLGLLVEEQRANLVTYSENISDLGTPFWTNRGTYTTFLDSSALSPADREGVWYLTDGSGVAYDNTFRTISVSVSASTTYVFSIYAKARNVETGFTIRILELQGQSIAEPKTINSSWQRFTTSITTSATAASVVVLIGLASASDEVYLWGAQLEVGSFPTSYIPTSGTTATRAADVTSISGSNFSSWYRQDEGTMFYDGQVLGTESGNKNLLGLSTGSGSNVIDLFIPSGINQRFRMVTGGVQQVLQNAIPLADVYSPAKVAYAFKLDDTTSAGNGAVQSTDTSCTIPTVDRFTFGLLVTGEAQAAARFKRLTYWPARLPNETLQTITQ